MMKKSQAKRVIGALALLILSFGLSFTLAEIVLRYMFPIGVSSSFKHRIPHPVFGWTLEPGANYLNKRPEDTVRVIYNSKGWRDVEHSFKNDRGTFRILVLGDSFMEGYSVELENMFHKQLERLASNNAVDIEIINLGVGGYGTLQEYLVFRDIGKNYNPDIVLLGFYLDNDVTNNSFALESMGHRKKTSRKIKSRPFLNSSKSKWEITQVDFEGSCRRYLSGKAKSDASFHRLSGQLALTQAASHAAKHLRIMWTGNNDNFNENKDATGETNNKKDRNFARYGINYCQEPPEFTEAWLTTKRILTRLKNDVSSIGAKLFVYTVPGLYEVDTKRLKKKVMKYELMCTENLPAYDRLAGILNELDIGHVNLLPGFRKDMKNDALNLFLASDKHWNEQGHKLAAEIVYSSLIEEMLFPFVKKGDSAH
jgi:hypothetical protein